MAATTAAGETQSVPTADHCLAPKRVDVRAQASTWMSLAHRLRESSQTLNATRWVTLAVRRVQSTPVPGHGVPTGSCLAIGGKAVSGAGAVVRRT